MHRKYILLSLSLGFIIGLMSGCDGPVSEPVTPETVSKPASIDRGPSVADLISELPLDGRKSHLTIFVPDAASVDTHPVVQWFNTDPQLIAMKERCHFHVYHPGMAMFESRWKGLIDVSPTVCLQNSVESDGGRIVFLAKGASVGSTPDVLKRRLAASLRVNQEVGRLECLCPQTQKDVFPVDNRLPSQPSFTQAQPTGPLPDLFMEPDYGIPDDFGVPDEFYPVQDDTAAFMGLILALMATSGGVVGWAKYQTKKASYFA